jgi:hypothetical protein
MSSVTRRTEPIAVIDKPWNLSRRITGLRTIRREQKQASLTKLAKLAVARRIGTSCYHGSLLHSLVGRINNPGTTKPGFPVL